MEVILAVIRPKPNTSAHDYKPKHYDILLLDHRSTGVDKGSKPTKFLPVYSLNYADEEPRDEVLTHLYQLTGGDHGGIKGERALLIPWDQNLQGAHRESLSRFYLYCIPVNSRDKLSRTYADKLSNTPSFFSLEYVLDSINSGLVNFPPPTRTFVMHLEGWLKEKHSRPHGVDNVFRSRVEYRIRISVNNPAFLPMYSGPPSPEDGVSAISTDMPEEIRLTANETMAKMLAIEKCDIVVMNPLFGSGLPYKAKVNYVVKNQYWGIAWSRRSSDDSMSERPSMGDKYPVHYHASVGNVAQIQNCLARGYSHSKRDSISMTPIHWAAWYGRAEAIRILLDAGCSPNVSNSSDGFTPLHMVARNGYPQAAEILLQHPDVDINARDKSGKMPLNLCEHERDWQREQVATLIRNAISQSNLISVNVADGAVKQLKLVSGSNTTVQQLNHMMLREYGMPEAPYADIFTIWICSQSLELQLKPEHHPVQHLHDWKNRIVAMLTDGDPTKEEPQLKWRRNAKISLVEERSVLHPEAITLLFHEAYQNYIKALYPCKDQDVLMFASILMYMNLRKYEASSARTFLADSRNLQSLVPAPMLKAKSSNWVSRIHQQYRDFSERMSDKPEFRLRPEQVLKAQFLNFCRNLTVYGSAFFTGSLQGKSSHNHTQCHIGVNDVGIHIINSQTRVMLQSHKYSEIDWVFSPAVLEIQVVRPETKTDKSTSKKVTIRTKQAGMIDHLMKKLAQIHGAMENVFDRNAAYS